MVKVALIGASDPLTELLHGRLEASPDVARCDRIVDRGPEMEVRLRSWESDAVVYAAASRGARGHPDNADADVVFAACRAAGVQRIVVLSSAAIHAPSHKHPGRVAETHASARSAADPLAARWLELERAAQKAFEPGQSMLTILRPAAVLLRGTDDYFNRLLSRRWAITLAGHDPTLQFLSPEDLGAAVCRAVETSACGVFHIAPNGAIPWRKALRLARVRRLPAPRWMHRAVRAVAAPLGLAAPLHEVDRTRYSWTVSGDRARSKLDFSPRDSSAAAVVRLSPRAQRSRGGQARGATFDEFGLDAERIGGWRRRHIRFLHDAYWRVEVEGTRNLPRDGAGVMVGVHRGFMPFDGVMVVHDVVGATGRYPRFLIHPALVKFPFLANYMFKLGGIIACRENADYVLQRDGLLAVFPEGIRGAFSLYRDAYRISGFGRPDYVRLALRHRAPIIPFVTVGSAEIFPIFKKVDWRWWERLTEWPCFPL
ncbi:MAG: NAD(P)H-binding protein, partial [Acidobacteriota bacterium]